MNLHLAESKPEWAKLKPGERNIWQNLAAVSWGVVTPGNFVTLIGLILVIAGASMLISEQYWLAVWLIVAGRICDLLDGWLADISGTKSPLGEAFDTTVDKLGTLIVVAVLFYAQIAPWWTLAAILLPHVMIALLAVVAFLRKRRFHPSLIGKLSMALAWLSLVGLVVIRVVDPDITLVASAVYLLAGVSLVMAFCALAGYIKPLLKR